MVVGSVRNKVTGRNAILNKFKEKGYKFTLQRKVVVDMLLENKGKHMCTEDIYTLAKKKCPEIGLATVYRTLQLLEELGAVNKLNFDDGCSRYELSQQDKDHQHHHLICISCGRVQEVEDDLLEHLEEKIEEKNLFKVIDHRVKFFGLCSSCKAK